MPRAQSDFTPIYGTEQVRLSFDFAKVLTYGEILVTAAWNVSLVSGADTSPTSRLLGNPAIVGSKVTQLVGNYIDGATYNHSATVTTSNGQTFAVNADQGCMSVSP
jgi:hypothetical protein